MPMRKEAPPCPHGPAAGGPYSPAIKLGNLVFVAGQGPIDPATKQVVRDSFPAQVHRTLDNIKAILEDVGSGMEHVLKTTVFLLDINNFSAMNEIYATYFGEVPPARTTIQAAKLPLGIDIEIECVAYVPD